MSGLIPALVLKLNCGSTREAHSHPMLTTMAGGCYRESFIVVLKDQIIKIVSEFTFITPPPINS